MKAIEQSFQVIRVYYAVQGGSYFSTSVDDILVCDHSNESCWLPCDTVDNAVQGGSYSQRLWMKP